MYIATLFDAIVQWCAKSKKIQSGYNHKNDLKKFLNNDFERAF